MLRENGCAVDRGKAEAEGLQLVREGAPCANTDAPNRIGIVQVLGQHTIPPSSESLLPSSCVGRVASSWPTSVDPTPGRS